MTKDELINITCKWLDYFHSNYIKTKVDGTHFVAGSCQTDLRAFLNSVKDRDNYYEVLDEIYKKRTQEEILRNDAETKETELSYIVNTLMSFKTEDGVPYFNPEFLKDKFGVAHTIE